MRQMPICGAINQEDDFMKSNKKLLALCLSRPISLERIEAEIAAGSYTPDEITICAIKFAQECFCEYGNFVNEKQREPLLGELRSSALPGLIRLFLKYGLRPNAIYPVSKRNEDNLMAELVYIDNGYVAAETMRLLVEAGADMQAVCEGEPFFDRVAFAVAIGATEQLNRPRYDSLVHLWLVMLGYSGHSPVTMMGGYSAEIFKEHEKFSFAIKSCPDVPEGWQMQMFFKDTGITAATM